MCIRDSGPRERGLEVGPARRAGVGAAGEQRPHDVGVAEPGRVMEERPLGRPSDDARASSGAHFETPLAWAVHASQTGADRREVGELLLAAGAEIEPRFLDAAEGPLLELLEEAA